MRAVSLVVGPLLSVLLAAPSHGFEPPVLIRERDGAGSVAPIPCPLLPSLNGTCANYRWYNVCSGYIWLYQRMVDEHVGVLFGGATQPQVRGGNKVKRAITYFRNAWGDYTVDIFVDVDRQGDGCPDSTIASYLDFYASTRWNCWDLNIDIPPGVEYLILRMKPDPPGPPPYRNGVVTLATDGPYSQACDPLGVPRSFYYGVNRSVCLPWNGPTDRDDNFLGWLVIDCGVTQTEATSWGAIKGLFQ